MGNTFSPKAAQCRQLIEAYSVMVTRAFADPIAISGSDTGFATCATTALCATARPAVDSAAATSAANVHAGAIVGRGRAQVLQIAEICRRRPYWALTPVLVFFAG